MPSGMCSRSESTWRRCCPPTSVELRLRQIGRHSGLSACAGGGVSRRPHTRSATRPSGEALGRGRPRPSTCRFGPATGRAGGRPAVRHARRHASSSISSAEDAAYGLQLHRGEHDLAGARCSSSRSTASGMNQFNSTVGAPEADGNGNLEELETARRITAGLNGRGRRGQGAESGRATRTAVQEDLRPPSPAPAWRRRATLVITGPFEGKGVRETPSRQRIFTCRPDAARVEADLSRRSS